MSIKTPFSVISRSITSWHRGLEYATILQAAKQRAIVVGLGLLFAFAAVLWRLGDLMLFSDRENVCLKQADHFQILRRNIVDRNNEIIATNIITASAYVNPKKLLNIDEDSKKIAAVLKNISAKDLKKKLDVDKTFVWLARHIPPKLQQSLNNLGIPGLSMYRDQTRIYPHNHLFSHVLGMCGRDGDGLSGIEQLFDVDLQQGENDLALSLDLRVQHAAHDRLLEGLSEFSAIGGNAIVMNAKTGEILAMVSLPDFDPHKPDLKQVDAMFNRNTLGVYEPGSVFKIANFAIGLETGKANLNSMYDGSHPIKLGRFTINDFKGLNRVMTLTEAFLKSSNIASVKIAQSFGIKVQKEYLRKFGALDKAHIELPEVGGPIIPKDWREPSLMSVSYGYGLSQTPVQILTVITSIVNHGMRVQPTLLKRNAYKASEDNRVVSEKTSRIIRKLMRKVVLEGTAKNANVEGVSVFGKTGTVYKKQGKGYGKGQITTFVGGFPAEDPEIMIIVMLDDPKPTKESHGYAAAGWNSTKVARRIIEDIAPFYVKTCSVENTVDFMTQEDVLSTIDTIKTGYKR
ncbi:MAG: penicillin-binding protein 2 [Alphaproteobacteria bacterium]|nr:penicillin-binding protein 2 [Alphaproteobacteria bacterium]